jgi:hypothetical protein
MCGNAGEILFKIYYLINLPLYTPSINSPILLQTYHACGRHLTLSAISFFIMLATVHHTVITLHSTICLELFPSVSKTSHTYTSPRLANMVDIPVPLDSTVATFIDQVT